MVGLRSYIEVTSAIRNSRIVKNHLQKTKDGSHKASNHRKRGKVEGARPMN
jgi:hypothetical protein